MGQTVSAKTSSNECCSQYFESAHCCLNCLKFCLKSINETVQLTINSMNEEYKEEIKQCLSKYNLMTNLIECILEYLNFKSIVICHHDSFNSFESLDITDIIICKYWLKYVMGDNSKIKLRIFIDGIKQSGKTSLIMRSVVNKYKTNYEETLIEEQYEMLWAEIFHLELTDIVHPKPFDTVRNEWQLFPHIYVYCICPASDKNVFEKSLKKMQQIISNMIDSLKTNSNSNITSNKKHDVIPTAFIILSTKCDLKNQEYFYNEQSIIKWCKQYRIPFIEISAKESININRFFNLCIYEYWYQTQINCH